MSRKSEFASSWWAQRWIKLLERFGWSARLNRGRSYARHGNVLDIDVQPGLVRAKVQGSRKQPYRVEIGLKPLDKADWHKIFTLLRRKAIYAARLLSGEMPRDIEEIFKAAQVPLFPQAPEDLIMSCTCPDWASPCKHVAAVYYVLGSEFDRDPFLLFELRGRSKEQLMASLRGTRPERLPKANVPRVTSEPLEEHLTDFWQAGDELDTITIRVSPPPVPQAILKRLGTMPLVDLPEEWLGDLAGMYETVGKDALAFVHVSGRGPMRVPRMGPDLVGANGAAEEPEMVYTEAGEGTEQEETEAEMAIGPDASHHDAMNAEADAARSLTVDAETPGADLREAAAEAPDLSVNSNQPDPSANGRRGQGRGRWNNRGRRGRREEYPLQGVTDQAVSPAPEERRTQEPAITAGQPTVEEPAPKPKRTRKPKTTAISQDTGNEPAPAPLQESAQPQDVAPKRGRRPRATTTPEPNPDVTPALAAPETESPAPKPKRTRKPPAAADSPETSESPLLSGTDTAPKPASPRRRTRKPTQPATTV